MTGFQTKRRIAAERMALVVKCNECDDEHMSDEVEIENVEEDIYGQDVVWFICPVTKEMTKSLVYRL